MRKHVVFFSGACLWALAADHLPPLHCPQAGHGASERGSKPDHVVVPLALVCELMTMTASEDPTILAALSVHHERIMRWLSTSVIFSLATSARRMPVP